MKLTIFFFTLFHAAIILNAQSKLAGKYYSNSWNDVINLSISEDSIFEYSRSSHMQYDEAKGRIFVINDTIFFEYSKDNTSKDSSKIYASDIVSSTAQYRPQKLFFYNNKLFGIGANGEVIRKTKRQSVGNFIRHSDWKKWYRKKYFLFGPYLTKRVSVYYLAKVD